MVLVDKRDNNNLQYLGDVLRVATSLHTGKLVLSTSYGYELSFDKYEIEILRGLINGN